MIDIEGIEGFDRWPLADSVAHVVPDGDVVLRGLPSPDCEVDIFHGDTWVTSVSVVVDGSMVLPSHLFDDAIDNRLKLVLKVRGEVYGGYIIFLPVEESEPFDIASSVIDADGSIIEGTAYEATDFIDIDLVDDIVYQGRMRTSGYIAVASYDEDHVFVRPLLRTAQADDVHHFVPDGTYRFIRACAARSYDHYLQIHYRSRRR